MSNANVIAVLMDSPNTVVIHRWEYDLYGGISVWQDIVYHAGHTLGRDECVPCQVAPVRQRARNHGVAPGWVRDPLP